MVIYNKIIFHEIVINWLLRNQQRYSQIIFM